MIGNLVSAVTACCDAELDDLGAATHMAVASPASISSATPSGARLAKGRRGYFTGFGPAISAMAKKAKGRQIRDWHLNRRSGTDLFSLAREINPQVQGWINYYGAFYRSELRFLAWRINEHLVRWAMLKFKRFRGRYAKAMDWLQKVYQYQPGLFAHWQLVAFTAGRTVGAG
jgi:RNA-directed DNA polymerase